MKVLKVKLADMELTCVCDRSGKSTTENSFFDQFASKAKSSIYDFIVSSPNAKQSFLESAS